MRPIGYWLNRADRAVINYMNDMLNEYGLTWISWQVLDVIRDTPASPTRNSSRSPPPTRPPPR